MSSHATDLGLCEIFFLFTNGMPGDQNRCAVLQSIKCIVVMPTHIFGGYALGLLQRYSASCIMPILLPPPH